MSTFNTSKNSQKSNKKLYLILGGIVAIILIGVFSIVAVALGIMYLSGPTTTFEGKPNTNQTPSNINSNQQNSPQNSQMKSLLESKKHIFGKYKAYTIANGETNNYPFPKDTARATFFTEEKRTESTIITLSSFKTEDGVKNELETKKKTIKEKKLTLISEEKSANVISIKYLMQDYYAILECSELVCFTILTKNPSSYGDFQVLLSEKIVPDANRLAKKN